MRVGVIYSDDGTAIGQCFVTSSQPAPRTHSGSESALRLQLKRFSSRFDTLEVLAR